jgi:hypothetical protein
MDEMRAMKAIYVYSNHNLSEHIQSAGDRAAPRVAALCRNIAASHWSMLKGRCSRQAQS